MGGVQVQCKNRLQRGGLSVPQLCFAACSITLCAMVAFRTFALGGILALFAISAFAILPACLVLYSCWLLWKILRTATRLLIKAARSLGNFLRKSVVGVLVVSALSSVIALLHIGTGSEDLTGVLVPEDDEDTLSTSSDPCGCSPWGGKDLDPSDEHLGPESDPLNGEGCAEGWQSEHKPEEEPEEGWGEGRQGEHEPGEELEDSTLANLEGEGDEDNNNGRARGSYVAMAMVNADVIALGADFVGLLDVTGVGSSVVEVIRGVGSLVHTGEGDDETAEPENLATKLGKGCGYVATGAFVVGCGDPSGATFLLGCGLKVGQFVFKGVGKLMG